MTAAFTAPTITEEDLLAFHGKHFPGLQAPIRFFVSETGHEELPHTDGSEADDLGFYHDGTKRYLTDEQIQIFRHSELHRLLYQRELGISETSSPEAEMPDVQIPPPVKNAQSEASATGERRLKKNQRRRQRNKQKQRDLKHASANGTSRAFARPDNRKRTWDDFVDHDTRQNPNRLTHRRLAREMDEQRFESTELSYDD